MATVVLFIVRSLLMLWRHLMSAWRRETGLHTWLPSITSHKTKFVTLVSDVISGIRRQQRSYFKSCCSNALRGAHLQVPFTMFCVHSQHNLAQVTKWRIAWHKTVRLLCVNYAVNLTQRWVLDFTGSEFDLFSSFKCMRYRAVFSFLAVYRRYIFLYIMFNLFLWCIEFKNPVT